MYLSETLQALAADSAAATSGVVARCEAANFRWEEAVAQERAEHYADRVADATTHKSWRAEHKGHVTDYTYVAKDAFVCAETFLPVNTVAHLREDLDNTCLLRMESASRFAHRTTTVAALNVFWDRFFNSPKDLLKKATDWTEADRALTDELLKVWNDELRTDSRPMFATFLNDFGGDLKTFAKTDWPHTLRDRLGLTHLNPNPGESIPVVLMCYQLDEVRRARLLQSKKGAVASFARPTVLDAELSAAFVPAPLLDGGESYGRTLDLARVSGAAAKDFSLELLTYPLAYQAHHIKALGFVTRGHALLDDAAYLPTRNGHVQALRNLPDCTDFGELLA